MKTTTTLNVNPMLAIMKGADSSSLTIEPSVINEALASGLITKIAEREGIKGGNNIYHQVGRPQNNTILMHVKNDQYVVISRYVYCAAHNRYIDVMPVLQQFSFYSNKKSSNRCHVVAGTSKTLKEQGCSAVLYLTRILISLEIYGVLRNLDPNFDVHHKSDCWDNRQNMTKYIESSKHTHRNSHMTGRYVRSYTAFINILRSLNESYIKFLTVTTIA